MRNWHGNLSPFGVWHTGRRARMTLAQFAGWFLASGSWDNDGRWFDLIPWDPDWFLVTGRIDVLGAWSDSEAW
jgi:hypothetical protein